MSWRHLASDVQDTCLDEFAERDEASLYTTQVDPGTGPVDVRAIFLDPWLEVVSDLNVSASTREIRADVAISELPSYPPAKAWRFLIRRPLEGDPLDSTSGVTSFEIVDHEPDGEGLVRLRLRRPRAPASP